MARPARLVSTADPLPPFLGLFETLPFIRSVRILDREAKAEPDRFDAHIRLEVAGGACEYCVETKRSYLDAAITRAVLSLASREFLNR